VAKVYVNGEKVGERTFSDAAWYHSVFPVAGAKEFPRRVAILTEPPFIPDKVLGNRDTRKLGVAIAKLEFIDELPAASLDFWDWESENQNLSVVYGGELSKDSSWEGEADIFHPGRASKYLRGTYHSHHFLKLRSEKGGCAVRQ